MIYFAAEAWTLAMDVPRWGAVIGWPGQLAINNAWPGPLAESQTPQPALAICPTAPDLPKLDSQLNRLLLSGLPFMCYK